MSDQMGRASYLNLWVTGATGTGKTTRLVRQFVQWVETGFEAVVGAGTNQDFSLHRVSHAAEPRFPTPMPVLSQRARFQQRAQSILVFAANGDNRLDLTDRLILATQGNCPIQSTSPLGFFEQEVLLFWPLLMQTLDLKAQFPLRLRPENEQELATRLWRSQLDDGTLYQPGLTEPRLVRRLLDFFQLATQAGIPTEDITSLLEQGLPDQASPLPPPWTAVGNALLYWRDWCLARGLLTYGLIAELYWRYLLPDATYQKHLARKYRALLADDVDNYPAIVRHLFEVLLNQGAIGAFSYNPDGAVRLGLGADPHCLAELAARCQEEHLVQPVIPCLVSSLGEAVVELLDNPLLLTELPEVNLQLVQTVSRAQLLRQTADLISDAVKTGQVQPQNIAVIAPGIDAIARYTLTEILAKQGIPVQPLNEQRPLISSSIVRALLTLLTLVYPGLGRMVNREAIAEMLVILSQQPTASSTTFQPAIDPVRAGLIADHCFEPHPDRPQLLPVSAFPRWDRLGYQATQAYETFLIWLEEQKRQQEQRLLPTPIALLDRAIQQFFWGGSHLPTDQLSALRELMETAQHYWQVDTRLRQSQSDSTSPSSVLGNFIQLLRNGTITANPFPLRPLTTQGSVTLANVFQYRSSRRYDRWQFWLDVGSPRWLSGTDYLYGYGLFLQDWSGRPWTEEDTLQAYQQRLHRILLDLLGRARERVFLCHSDLAVSGQEQMGPLLALLGAVSGTGSTSTP